MLQHEDVSQQSETSAAAAERRRRERKRVRAEITLTPISDSGEEVGEPFAVSLRNLSAKGCGIRTGRRLTPGAHYMALFPKPDSPGLQVLARVRHCRGSEAAGFVIGMSFELGGRAAR
jgi:hypothetical protein